MYKKIMKWGSMVCLCMFIGALQATDKHEDDYKSTPLPSPEPVKQYASQYTSMLQKLSDEDDDNEINEEQPSWSRKSSINNDDAQIIDETEETNKPSNNIGGNDIDEDKNLSTLDKLKSINQRLSNLQIIPIDNLGINEEDEEAPEKNADWGSYLLDKGKQTLSNPYVQAGLGLAISAAWQLTKAAIWEKVTTYRKIGDTDIIVDDKSKPIYDTNLVDDKSKPIYKTYERTTVDSQSGAFIKMKDRVFQGYEQKEVQQFKGYEQKTETFTRTERVHKQKLQGIDYNKLLPGDLKIALRLLAPLTPATWTIGKRLIKDPKKRRRVRKRTENAGIGFFFGWLFGPGAGTSAATGAETGDKAVEEVEKSKSYNTAKEKTEKFVRDLDDVYPKFEKYEERVHRLEKDIAENDHIDNIKKQTIQKLAEEYKKLPKDSYENIVKADEILEKLEDETGQVFDRPNLPIPPKFNFWERAAIWFVTIGNTYTYKLFCATAGVAVYYLAIPYAAVFPRSSLFIVGSAGSSYLVAQGLGINKWTILLEVAIMCGLAYVLFNDYLPRAAQQNDVKAIVEEAVKAVKKEAKEAPIKLRNAPKHEEPRKTTNPLAIILFILAALGILGIAFKAR